MNKWKIDLQPMKSSTYMLPLVDTQLNFKFLHLLVGSYLFNNHKDLEFSVLYKYSGKVGFTEYEKEMMSHTLYIGHEDYGEYTLYKFRLTENMQKAMDLYVLGQYSSFTEEHKQAIISFLGRRGVTNVGNIKQILYRDEARRLKMEEDLGVKIPPGSELSSPPDVSLEVFDQYVSEIIINKDTFDEDIEEKRA